MSSALTEHQAMKSYGGVELKIHTSLTSALDGGGQLHAPAA
jgi:hypothetical protein